MICIHINIYIYCEFGTLNVCVYTAPFIVCLSSFLSFFLSFFLSSSSAILLCCYFSGTTGLRKFQSIVFKIQC